MDEVCHWLLGDGWLTARVKCTGNMWRASGLTGSQRREQVTCARCLAPKRPSALAPRREPKVSLADIQKAFERAKEGM